MVVIVNGVEIEIDEDLFGGDDIDDVEDELEILDLVDDQSICIFFKIKFQKKFFKMVKIRKNCCDCDEKKK